MARKGTTIIIFAILIFLAALQVARLITDYMWFKQLGYQSIFIIGLEAKVFIFLIAAVVFFLFAMINLYISGRVRKSKSLIPLKYKIGVILFLTYIISITASTVWLKALQFFRQVNFNIVDPIFSRDIAFYVFSLPFISSVWRFTFAVVLITLVIVGLDYLQAAIASLFAQRTDPTKAQLDIMAALKKLKKGAIIHISLLLAILFALIGFNHWLARFSIMFSEAGIVVGAGYTDVVTYLPAVRVLMVLAFAISALFIVWGIVAKIKKSKLILYAIGVYLIVSFLGLLLVPAIVQTLRVAPNEISLEKPYIENNIKFTNIAYGLDSVEERDFSAEGVVNTNLLERNKQTIDNIRILDWRPLTTTYKQTQEIRLYYDLSGIDIDRYDIDGTYTQVMLAPREMDQAQITDNAKTWVNLHMIYTHGYGVVMSPVNSVTAQGLPNYFIQDIPPAYSVEEESIRIDQPEIYYGERDNDFVLVNTDTEEFNYPKGNSNEYIQYDGKGGLVLDSFVTKLLMAIRFSDIKILLSTNLKPGSKILFNRDIQMRIKTLTPFLALDRDPYLAIADGKLYWIQDAYTTTGNYPYSQKTGSINYIRNSAKVVVDAYNGDVTYYITDKEPMIETYSSIFYDQFKDIDDMPTSLRKHTRYPEDLFKIQSEIYSTYHMGDPTVFYNKEDAWQIPNEIYGSGQRVPVEPYYNILKLPGESDEEFVLMTSFTPIKKDNMVAWLAARSDNENYGKLLLFKFPKDSLVYGPSQIEARFDQDSVISQQLTLWNQQGSSVTRGNLLVIPIEESVLYVEPLYIQSEQGQLPELKRVLVSDGENVAMEETLADALAALYGRSRINQTDRTDEQMVQDANNYYNKVQDSIKEGDWAGIGDNLDELGDVLQRLLSGQE